MVSRGPPAIVRDFNTFVAMLEVDVNHPELVNLGCNLTADEVTKVCSVVSHLQVERGMNGRRPKPKHETAGAKEEKPKKIPRSAGRHYSTPRGGSNVPLPV